MKVNLTDPWGNLTTLFHFSCVPLFDGGGWVKIQYFLPSYSIVPRGSSQNCLPLICNFVCSPVLPVLQPTLTWMTSANSCAAQATPISLEPNDRRITQRAISRGFPLVPRLLVWSLGGCALMIYTTKWALTSFATFVVIFSTVSFAIHFAIARFNRYGFGKCLSIRCLHTLCQSTAAQHWPTKQPCSTCASTSVHPYCTPSRPRWGR